MPVGQRYFAGHEQLCALTAAGCYHVTGLVNGQRFARRVGVQMGEREMLSGKRWDLIGNHQMRGVGPAFFSGLLHGLDTRDGEVIGVVTLLFDDPADHSHCQRRVAPRVHRLPVTAIVSQYRG
ncbi:hypothetical protein D3C73_1113340 [compost metagenome]